MDVLAAQRLRSAFPYGRAEESYGVNGGIGIDEVVCFLEEGPVDVAVDLAAHVEQILQVKAATDVDMKFTFVRQAFRH